MYADQITTGRKRSIHDRIDDGGGGGGGAAGRIRMPTAKRQRQNDDKWKHDLYWEDEESQASKSINPRDLRLKLQKKSSQQGYTGDKGSGVRDLREKLSGTMHPQPPNIDHPKAKPTSEVVKLPRYESHVETPAPEMKKVPKPTSSKTAQQKAESSVDGFLRSLGLEKYSITFLAEEVDMAALRHMTDDDLKALGVPMGPRKKIRLALESRA